MFEKKAPPVVVAPSVIEKNTLAGRKAKTVSLVHATTLIGTSVGGDTTFNKSKQPGIELTLLENGGILVEFKGIQAVIPQSNIKSIVLE